MFFILRPLIGLALCVLWTMPSKAVEPKDTQGTLLKMHYQDLNDELIETIATALGQSTCFTRLSLKMTYSATHIPTLETADIAAALCQPDISILDLCLGYSVYEDQNTAQTDMIITALSKIPNLSGLTHLELGLSGLPINNAAIKALVTISKPCSKIKNLNFDLHLNPVDTEGAKDFAQALEQWGDLTHLKLGLSTHSIGIEGLEDITKALRSLTKLVRFELDLGWGPTNIHRNASAIIMSTFLTHLKARQHEIHPNAYAKCEQMQKYLEAPPDVAMNDKKIAALASLIRSLKNPTTLQLHIYGNHFSSRDVIVLIGALRECPNLTKLMLNMQANRLDDAGARNLGMELGYFTSIEALSLNLLYNRISEGAQKALKDSLQRLPNLKHEQFYFNQVRRVEF